MQILDKAITPDGIEIELRDLSGEHKLPDYNGLSSVQSQRKHFHLILDDMHKKEKNFIHVFVTIKITHQIC